MKEIVNILSDSYFTMCSCFYLNQVFVVVPQREKKLSFTRIISIFNNSTFGNVKKWHERTIHIQSWRHIIKWLITFQTSRFVILRNYLSPWISDSHDRLNLSPHAPGYLRQKKVFCKIHVESEGYLYFHISFCNLH